MVNKKWDLEKLRKLAAEIKEVTELESNPCFQLLTDLEKRIEGMRKDGVHISSKLIERDFIYNQALSDILAIIREMR